MLVAETHDLTIGYRGHAVVRQASWSIQAGEIAGLLGVSGSGKSTFGRALLGRLPPGAAIFSGRFTRQGRAALIPQEPALALSPFLRAGVQVRDCTPDPGTSRSAILELFARLGLDQPERIERSYPHQLSGGQQQRVAWAQALIQRPALLIADEPTTALDPIRQRELASLITGLAREQGCAILWISHDPHLLRAITSRLAVMHEGRFVEQGTTADVLDHPAQPYTRQLCEASR